MSNSSSCILRYVLLTNNGMEISILCNSRVGIVLCVIVFFPLKLSCARNHHVGTYIVRLIECQYALISFCVVNDLLNSLFLQFRIFVGDKRVFRVRLA